MKPDSNAIAPQIVDRAAEWFVSLREPNVSREEREAFADWLRASPAHLHAYLDIARLWGDASKIDPAIEAISEAASLPTNVVSLREEASARRRGSQQTPRQGSRRFAIAATVVLALAAVFGVWWGEHPKQYVTAIGEQRLITLNDGSIVRLNARSKIRVRFSPELRRIELIDGQALFEVAKDPQRPFIVQGGPVAVRAVGTQFDVYRRRSGTVVTVVEGAVEVRAGELGKPWHAQSSSGNAAHLEMRAGERLKVSSAGQVGHEKDVDVESATSWLHQELTFTGEPLGAVVEEFNRYSPTPIVIADPSLADLRINAVFHTTSPDSLLRFIDRMQDIDVAVASEKILITRQR